MGLVQYDSSDEDGDEQMQMEAQPQPQPQRKENTDSNGSSAGVIISSQTAVNPEPLAPPPQQTQNEGEEAEPVLGPQLLPPTGPVLGPALGPSRPPELSDPQSATPPPGPQPPSLAEVDMSFLETESDPNEPPKSPYTAQRSLLRDLTLPAIDISTLDIPPSPPASPSPSSQAQLQALNTKFDEFLRLKRTRGVHFNERLANSTMMRNPSLMDKMLGFVGIETEFLGPDDVKATEQYLTTLPSDLWDPGSFPEWAYKGMLRKAQERVTKERERAKGEPVQFVGGGVVGGDSVAGGLSAPGSRSGTPGVGGGSSSTVAGKRKSRFDA
ncbi:HCNGP-like protein-domain-containing protein [Rhypophila decipiens]|uniref:HCNGP-like protein-domain-containing protein n=1 Tax=Rhypophila decipiens TaxID=261697 RepID=A0AAN7B365_9PEZI|nr:HCNGP-like protein-domain-containing protein [Rhypophila decipiens]